MCLSQCLQLFTTRWLTFFWFFFNLHCFYPVFVGCLHHTCTLSQFFSHILRERLYTPWRNEIKKNWSQKKKNPQRRRWRWWRWWRRGGAFADNNNCMHRRRQRRRRRRRRQTSSFSRTVQTLLGRRACRCCSRVQSSVHTIRGTISSLLS